MLTLIATILGFILPLLTDCLSDRNKAPTYAKDKQKFNSYLAGGDAPGLSAMFEQLHRPAGGDGDPGRPDDNKAA